MFSSLSDPADVVIVLLSDAISRFGTNFLQDSCSNVIRYSKILGVARGAHPAKRAKAQRENVSVTKAEGGRLQIIYCKKTRSDNFPAALLQD